MGAWHGEWGRLGDGGGWGCQGQNSEGLETVEGVESPLERNLEGKWRLLEPRP